MARGTPTHGARTTKETRVRTAAICDDDEGVRAVLRQMLVDEGWHVLGDVGSASTMLELMRTDAPDLLVLDVAMPGVSGLEAIEDLKRAGPDTTIVLLSAVDVSTEEFVTSGAGASLSKADLQLFPQLLRRLHER
jgi:DNA-binding NarL/FixJ family response regulator